MRPLDVLRIAFNSLRQKKVRAILTILGIIIGPATIVTLVGTTAGFQLAITQQLYKLGITTIVVSPSSSNYALTPLIVLQMEKLPGVSAVLPFFLFSGTVRQGDQVESVQVMATDLSRLPYALPGLRLSGGSLPPSDDPTAAVIGYRIAFPQAPGASNVSLGSVIQVNLELSAGSLKPVSFYVSGVYQQFGQGFFINPDEGIFIPLIEGEIILQTTHYTGVLVIAKDLNSVNSVVQELQNLLGNGYTVVSVSSAIQTVRQIINAIGSLLTSIAGISLVVAFIGIMTTMYTSVLERTREIGVMKALGFTNSQVLLLFEVESLITGLSGGTIGSTIGAMGSYFLAPLLTRGFSADLRVEPVITPTLILGVIALASIIGLIAGAVPAWRAARLSPTEALRSL